MAQPVLLLGCGHCVCSACIAVGTEVVAGQPACTCPVCSRVSHTKSPQQPCSVPLQELHTALLALHVPTSICNECDMEEAVHHCPKCDADLCQACCQALHSHRALSAHCTLPLSLKPTRGRCPEHARKLKLYCADCCEPRCLFCRDFGPCEHHELHVIEEAGQQCKQQLADGCRVVGEVVEKARLHLIFKQEDSVDQERARVRLLERISSHFNALQFTLRERRLAIEEGVQELYATRAAGLYQHTRDIGELVDTLQAVQVTSEGLLERCDEVVLTEGNGVLDRLDRTVARAVSALKSGSKERETEVVVELDSLLFEVLQRHGTMPGETAHELSPAQASLQLACTEVEIKSFVRRLEDQDNIIEGLRSEVVFWQSMHSGAVSQAEAVENRLRDQLLKFTDGKYRVGQVVSIGYSSNPFIITGLPHTKAGKERRAMVRRVSSSSPADRLVFLKALKRA